MSLTYDPRAAIARLSFVDEVMSDLITRVDAPLRSAGLSADKLLAVRDLVAKAQDGTVPTLAVLRRLSDAEIIERLTAERGIGTWTVDMLLFRLGRPDVLPIGVLPTRKRALVKNEDSLTTGLR
jgi:DNA-3-methyladenine glycosylase II